MSHVGNLILLVLRTYILKLHGRFLGPKMQLTIATRYWDLTREGFNYMGVVTEWCSRFLSLFFKSIAAEWRAAE